MRAQRIGLIAGGLLLACIGHAAAQTATTTTTTVTTTTTTTTLLPHPYSPATHDCVQGLKKEKDKCHRTGGDGPCGQAYDAAFPNCFLSPAGVSCAKKCVSNKTTCFAKVPTTKKKCHSSCRSARKADVKACKLIAVGGNIWAGGDASCLATAQSNFDLCSFVCTEAEQDCRTAFKFCVANCPNL
jgi:hypothetical protein